MSDKSKICVKDGESLVRSEKIKRYARYNAVFIMLIAAFVLITILNSQPLYPGDFLRVEAHSGHDDDSIDPICGCCLVFRHGDGGLCRSSHFYGVCPFGVQKSESAVHTADRRYNDRIYMLSYY